MRLAYVVSRFPHASETFIARELAALEDSRGETIDLLALFPPVDSTLHPSAARFAGRLMRPGAREAVAATGWWAVRRPLRLASSLGVVVREHLRSPGLLWRALVTFPLAAAHARAVRRRGVEHVHAHYATYPALSAWICRRLAGTPYSITAHAHDIFVDQSMLRRKLADASFTVTISEFNRRYLSRFADPERIYVVHAGIDVSAYTFRPRAVPQEGPVRALCVASLQEYKGHAVLLEALAGAPALERVELELVGSGPLRAELEERVARLGLSPRVRFAGSVPEDVVRSLLERADLLVLPSVVARDGQMEGLPVVLMEALASGVPVVATRLSGVPELVEHERMGLRAAPGDPADLRNALERVVSGRFEPDLAEGRALVERSFDVAHSAVGLGHLFESARESALEQTSSKVASSP
jgi:colanic acid/amylovoran biosynthesis glycosyltransferase